jgi:hypothetical protein
MNHTIATFRVQRRWKGPTGEQLLVHFRWNPDSALCEYQFEKDKAYLVFAYGHEPTASGCDYTRALTDGDAPGIEARLGKPAWERTR